MASNEAEFCPFCGSRETLTIKTERVEVMSARFRTFVICNKCLCRGPSHISKGESLNVRMDMAIELWGQRHNPTVTVGRTAAD